LLIDFLNRVGFNPRKVRILDERGEERHEIGLLLRREILPVIADRRPGHLRKIHSALGDRAEFLFAIGRRDLLVLEDDDRLIDNRLY
jgi:hypothetical protein